MDPTRLTYISDVPGSFAERRLKLCGNLKFSRGETTAAILKAFYDHGECCWAGFPNFGAVPEHLYADMHEIVFILKSRSENTNLDDDYHSSPREAFTLQHNDDDSTLAQSFNVHDWFWCKMVGNQQRRIKSSHFQCTMPFSVSPTA